MAAPIDTTRMSTKAIEARRKFGRFPRYDGYMLPAFSALLENVEEKMESIKKLDCQDDDIFLCTYPKSGTNWTYEILTMLLSGKAQYARKSKPEQVIETGNILTETTPRIIPLHLPYRHLPEQLTSKKIKIVHMVRNPKDVYVSLFCHMRDMAFYNNPLLEGCPGTWSNFITKNMSGEYNLYDGWCNYEKEFENAAKDNGNIIVIYYEDMKQNPVFELVRLAEFLGVPYNKQLISDIAVLTEFNKQKTAVAEQNRDKASVQINGRNLFYRKGEIGDWKNWFTITQNEMFDKMLEREMACSKLKMIFEYQKE